MIDRAYLWLHQKSIRYFMLIAEPRVLRIIQCAIYICMMFAGVRVLANPPPQFQGVLGIALSLMFGGFLFLGSIFGAIAVLPGIWWLERVGIIALWTGLGIYAVVIVSLGSSPVGITVAIAFGLCFLQRWREIKGAQLAPREE